MAEASAGLAGWPEHSAAGRRRRAGPAAPPRQRSCWRTPSAAPSATRRRSRSSIARGDASCATSELGLQLEAAAVIAEFNDPATMPPVSPRRRDTARAGRDDPAAPPSSSQQPRSSPSWRTSRPRTPPSSRAARFTPETAHRAAPLAGSGFSSTAWFSASAFTLLWSERYASCGRCSMPRSHRRGRPATAAGSPYGLAVRCWLALRRGDLRPPRQTPGRRLPPPSSPRHPCSAC
jgi:hypothetical protein